MFYGGCFIILGDRKTALQLELVEGQIIIVQKSTHFRWFFVRVIGINKWISLDIKLNLIIIHVDLISVVESTKEMFWRIYLLHRNNCEFQGKIFRNVRNCNFFLHFNLWRWSALLHQRFIWNVFDWPKSIVSESVKIYLCRNNLKYLVMFNKNYIII